jgi:hypothetical protein
MGTVTGTDIKGLAVSTSCSEALGALPGRPGRRYSAGVAQTSWARAGGGGAALDAQLAVDSLDVLGHRPPRRAERLPDCLVARAAGH